MNRALLLPALLAASPALLGAAVDVTTLGVIPDDGINDSPAIAAALVSNRELFFPPGEYTISNIVFVPSNSAIFGAGMDETVFRLGADTSAFRCDGTTAVCFQGFEIYRPFDNSREEMIFCYNGASNINVIEVRARDNTSRAPSIRFIQTSFCTVAACETINDQRRIFEDGENQVYGSGITFESSTDLMVLNNSLTQTVDLRILDNPYFNYYQSGGIQVSSCQRATIAGNYIQGTGQAIDAGGTVDALIEGNVIDDVHSIGIKLVNGSTRQTVRGNFITRAGLVGVSLGPGSTDLAIVDCLVEDNVFSRIGEGMGVEWWDGFFTDTVPAGVHLDAANSQEGRSRDNTIQNNLLYNSPETRFAYIVRPSDLSALNTTLINNQTTNDPPPPTPPPVDQPYNQCIDPAAREADWMLLDR